MDRLYWVECLMINSEIKISERPTVDFECSDNSDSTRNNRLLIYELSYYKRVGFLVIIDQIYVWWFLIFELVKPIHICISGHDGSMVWLEIWGWIGLVEYVHSVFEGYVLSVHV